MRLYLQSPTWGKTTVLRQSHLFSGCINGFYWTPFPDTSSDFLICSDVGRLPSHLLALGREKRVFVMHENPSIWKPSPDFLSQYGIVISPFIFDVPNHVRFIQAHSGVPWFYGINFHTNTGLLHSPQRTQIELSSISNRNTFVKTKQVSMIVSGKSGLEGHRWRQAVANQLSHIRSLDIDIYGFGHNPLPDKSLALDEYRFSIVIENTSSTHYWTEKLSDCILGGAVPIYAGALNAPNDLNYDMPVIQYGSDPAQAANNILTILSTYNVNYDALRALRNTILFKHNMLAWIPHLLLKHV